MTVQAASNTRSEGPEGTAANAWDQAAEEARNVGIRWERPPGDERSAEEIIADNALLRQLGNQRGVRDALKDRVGDFERDANAAYRAEQVLRHIEAFGGDGTRLLGKEIGNGRIDGFNKRQQAKDGSEAARLLEFAEQGFASLHGTLGSAEWAASDTSARQQAEALGILWQRPANDQRSAREIVAADPLLRNLGNQSHVSDMLKERVGDFTTDADAAYRATQVLEHLERYDGEGHDLSGGEVGNGRVDGFTKGGEAKHGTEAGRLQDFGKYGFANLKGPAPTEQSRLDFARESAGLPPVSELDSNAWETSTQDPADPDRRLTVNELTWRNLLADWKTGIEQGRIGKDDDRTRLYTALRAQAARDGGLDMVVLDIAQGQGSTHAEGQDFAAIIDGDKVDRQVAELFASEGVQKDFQAQRSKALGEVPDQAALSDKLERLAFSEDYAHYIGELQRSGQGERAKADMGEVYASLAALEPDKAAQFSQHMMITATTVDLDALARDPSLITDDNTVLATQDAVKTLLAALKKGGVDLTRRTLETERFVQEFLGDKQTAKAFGNALQELGATFAKQGSVTAADIDKVMGKDLYRTLGEGARGSLAKTLVELNGNGALGSLGGLVSLASGVYQLAGKGGTLADTPEERLAIAKDFVSVLGAGQHFVNLGSTLHDRLWGTQVNQLLGLDKSLPEIFGKDVPAGSGRNLSLVEGDLKRLFEDFNAAVDAAPTPDKEALAKKLDLTPEQWTRLNSGFREGFAKNPGLPGSTPSSRAASAFLRVMDAGANSFAGVADLVLGSLKIKSGLAGDDQVAVAQGAITVAAGAFNVAGGGAQLGALIGSSAARALAAPLLWAGAALTVALTPFLIVEDIKHNQRMDAQREDLRQLFADLDAQGLLREDGLRRYAFLDDYLYNYGQRDAPSDRSVFDFRADEYRHYLDNGHVYWDGEHQDYAGDGANLDSLMA